jgi:hypothetical protein
MKKHVQVMQSQVTFVCRRLPTLMLCVCLRVIWEGEHCRQRQVRVSRQACKRPPPPSPHLTKRTVASMISIAPPLCLMVVVTSSMSATRCTSSGMPIAASRGCTGWDRVLRKCHGNGVTRQRRKWQQVDKRE